MSATNSTRSPQARAQHIVDAADDAAKDVQNAANAAPWPLDVEEDARELANALRVKDDQDLHTVLGKDALPASIVALLRRSANARGGQDPKASKSAAYELLRLSANLCMDHDPNRQQFLDAGFHDLLLEMLKTYTAATTELTSDDLRVAKTAIGALLNSCFSFEPARAHLVYAKAPATVINAANTVYPPARWPYSAQQQKQESLEDLIAAYQLRIGLADWSWRLLSAITEGTSASPIGEEALAPLVAALPGFIPSSDTQPSSPLLQHAESRKALIVADVESLEECVTLLEGLSLDSEPIRVHFIDSLASSSSSSSSSSLLNQLVEFIEKADYPTYWTMEDESERKGWIKSFDTCKAGCIKALISILGEQKAMDTIWKDHQSFVDRMKGWVRTDAAQGSGRDDLIIAGCLALGNLARKDSHCEALVQSSDAILPTLIDLLKPESDIKVKHAITGLLKNLTQASSNRRPLGKAGVLERLVSSEIWGQGCDMAETVQVSAIGAAKHLCNGDVDNTLRLVVSKEPTGTEQLVALVGRSDSIVVKSEGTRVLAYCVKSVWKKESATSPTSPTTTGQVDPRKQQAMDALAREPIITALTTLIVIGSKHTILLNESIFALTLLSSNPATANLVYASLETLVVTGEPPTSATAEGVEQQQQQELPASAMAMVESILSNDSGKHPPELRANACSLVGTLARSLPKQAEREALRTRFDGVVKGLLAEKEVPDKLAQTAKWAANGLGRE